METNFESFVREVAELGPPDLVEDLSDTAKAVEGTLEVLGQRLADDVKAKLAGHLPADLRDALFLRKRLEVFDADEFVNRVRAIAAVGYPAAYALVGYTFRVLRQHLPADAYEEMRAALTPDYHPLVHEQPWESHRG